MKVPGLSSGQLMLGVTLLMTYTTTVSSLYCYSCSYNKVESSTTVVDWLLNGLSSLSDEHCLLRKDSDGREAHQRECPEPESGKVAKCVVINGTATADIEIAGISISKVKYHSLVRDCIEVNSDDDDYSDGCHDDLPSTAHSVFDDAFDKLKLGDLAFKGKACYSTDKNRYADTSSAGRNGAVVSLVMLLVWTVSCFH